MLRRPEGATVDEVASQRLDARFGLQPSGGDQMLYRSSLDSPLEGRVSSEPVSEWAFSGLANYGLILRCLWMIPEA